MGQPGFETQVVINGIRVKPRPKSLSPRYDLGIWFGLDEDIKELSGGNVSPDILHQKDEGISYDLYVATLLPYSIKLSMDFWVAYDGPCMT